MIFLKDFSEIFKFIFLKIKKYNKSILILIFISYIYLFASLVSTLLSKQIMDEVFYNKNINFLNNKMIIMVVFLFIAIIMISIFKNYMSTYVYNTTDSYLKQMYFSNILNGKYSLYFTTNQSEIYYRMFKDLAFLNRYVIEIIVDIPIKMVQLIVYIGIMFYWSSSLTLIFMIFAILQVISIIYFRKPTHNIISKQRKEEQQIISEINSNFEKAKIIKIYSLEKHITGYINNQFNKYKNTMISNDFIIYMFQGIGGFIFSFWNISLLILGAYLVYNDKLTVGEYVVISSISTNIIPEILYIFNKILKFEETKISFKRMNEYYTNSNELKSLKKGVIDKFNEISFNSVDFEYSNGKEIFTNLSFNMKSNSIISIIGKNGCGKSTLIQILGKLLYPKNGEIFIDDINIEDIADEEYRKLVSVVLQDIKVFEDTIRENIRLFNKEYSDDDIYKVLEHVNLKEKVLSLPDKLDTIVGSKSNDLSQGEKQKLNIARCFIRRPKILVLDEPTSAIDKGSKKEILEYIKSYQIQNESLVIIVTHDMDEIAISDTIIDLNNLRNESIQIG